MLMQVYFLSSDHFCCFMILMKTVLTTARAMIRPLVVSGLEEVDIRGVIAQQRLHTEPPKGIRQIAYHK